MSHRWLLLAVWSLCFPAAAVEKVTLRYRPEPRETDRPVATEVTVLPEGTDLVIRVRFNEEPWGEACKNHCANATVFIDTDDSRSTGLKLGDRAAPENGADLSVTLLGMREYQDAKPRLSFKVKVRELSHPADEEGAEAGSPLTELELQRDDERLQVTGKLVEVRIDSTNASLPFSKRMRVVYHPAGAQPVVGSTRGFLLRGSDKVQVLKGKRR